MDFINMEQPQRMAYFGGKSDVAFQMKESHQLKQSLYTVSKTQIKDKIYTIISMKVCIKVTDILAKFSFYLDRGARKIYVIQLSTNHLLKIIEKKYFFFHLSDIIIFWNMEGVVPGSFGHIPFLYVQA